MRFADDQREATGGGIDITLNRRKRDRMKFCDAFVPEQLVGAKEDGCCEQVHI